MHPTTLIQPTIIPYKDCCSSFLFPASTFPPQPFCNTISKSVLITCKPDHITPLHITPLPRTLSGSLFHLVLCDPVPCDHSNLRTQSLHSSPTGLLCCSLNMSDIPPQFFSTCSFPCLDRSPSKRKLQVQHKNSKMALGFPSLVPIHVCTHAKSLQSCPTLCDPWTVAHQAPLSLGFSRQEYWNGLPCPPPGDLPGPGIEP